MKKFSLITIIFLIMLFVIPVQGMIIDQHIAIDNEAVERTQNSPITQEVLLYEDYFNLGNILTDISVVSYFQIDNEADTFLGKLKNIFTFNIGKSYRATHSQNACLRLLNNADTPKKRAVAYGGCAHLVQDAISHNEAVPLAIEKSKLYNGLIHSVKEIQMKNLNSNEKDRIYSRQILDLAYDPEVVELFQDTYVNDPAFSNVDIESMIDFFVKNVQPEGEYRLGFRSFFALPSYIYWVIAIATVLFLSLFGLMIRRLRDGFADITTLFTTIFSFLGLSFMIMLIYGLLTGTIWSIWEKLSQFLFSPIMYIIGIGIIAIAGIIVFKWIMGDNKLKNISTILVSVFILSVGIYAMTLPGTLETGNEQQIHDKAVQETVNLLNGGVTYIKTIDDPVGFVALKEAEAKGKVARSLSLLYMSVLLILILYYTFRKKK